MAPAAVAAWQTAPTSARATPRCLAPGTTYRSRVAKNIQAVGMRAVSRSWPGPLDPLRYEPQRRSAAGDWRGHSAMPASAQPPPAGRSAAGTGQIPRPRLPVALQSVRLAQSLLPGPSAHAIAPASPSVVAGRLHSSREHPHLPPGDHIWQGAHPRGSPSVKSSFRSRISRTPGPIDQVHSFPSSWVTRYRGVATREVTSKPRPRRSGSTQQ